MIKLILLAISVFITGCSGTYHSYYQTLKLGLSSEPEPVISLNSVQNSPIDLMQVKRGDRTTVIMALAYIEAGQHKWLSADEAMLVFEKGRVVRTLGLSTDLIHLTNKDADPLKKIAKSIVKKTFKSSSQQTWDRKADWSGEYGYEIISNLSNAGEQTLNILSDNINTTLFIETLSYLAPTNYVQSDNTWKNYFWFHTTTGELVKSIQLLSPLDKPIEMVYLSRIARILTIKVNPKVNL